VVEEVAPRPLGWGLVELGGGRRALGDVVDPRVGFVLHVAAGERVAQGQSVGEVHVAEHAQAERGVQILREAVVLGERPARLRPLLSHRVTRSGVELL
jgi:thymidine phosphorylase